MNKFYRILASLTAVALLALPMGTAYANPLQTTSAPVTATATTTLTFMTPGTATTTLTYDSNQVLGTNQRNDGNTYSTDSAVLLTQLNASTTSTVLKVGIEYSNDGIDWYADNLQTITNATTSQALIVTTANSFTWTFASTTPNGGAVGNTNTSYKAVIIPTPTRFVRVFYSVTGANAAVWGTIIPRKQTR